MPTLPTTPPLPGITLVNLLNAKLEAVDSNIVDVDNRVASEETTRAGVDGIIQAAISDVGDRVTEEETTRAGVDGIIQAAILVLQSGKASANNPVFTGTVTLPGNPTLALHAAPKQYVDSTVKVAPWWPDSRPGENPAAWTSSVAGGDPSNLAPLSESLATAASDGLIIRITGQNIVSSRTYLSLEPSRVYNIRYVVRRRTDSADPGAVVRLAIRWYDSNKTFLSQEDAFDIDPLLVSAGRQERSLLVSRTGGVDITTAPANTRYARPLVQTFGTSGTTDIEVIDIVDVTDATIFSPDVTALQADIDALESLGIGARLTDLETQVDAPGRRVFLTEGDAAAATIPVTVEVITTIGKAAFDDGLGTSFIRAVGLSGEDVIFSSVDGADWIVKPESFVIGDVSPREPWVDVLGGPAAVTVGGSMAGVLVNPTTYFPVTPFSYPTSLSGPTGWGLQVTFNNAAINGPALSISTIAEATTSTTGAPSAIFGGTLIMRDGLDAVGIHGVINNDVAVTVPRGAALWGIPRGVVSSDVNEIHGVRATAETDWNIVGSVTITNASPAVIALNAHGYSAGQKVGFLPTTTGDAALPTGLVADHTYFVLAAGLTANTFQISETPGGAAINTSTAQTGVNRLFKGANAQAAFYAFSSAHHNRWQAGILVDSTLTWGVRVGFNDPTSPEYPFSFYAPSLGLSMWFVDSLGGCHATTLYTREGTTSYKFAKREGNFQVVYDQSATAAIALGGIGDQRTFIDNTTVIIRDRATSEIASFEVTGQTLLPTTASTSTITGALTVAGGVGVGGAGFFGGNISIVKAAPTLTLAASSSDAAIVFQASSAQAWKLVNSAGSNIFFVLDADGSAGVQIAQNATAWSAVSDARAKKNFSEITVLDKLENIRLGSFSWKRTSRYDVGFLAQDFYKAFPFAVTRGDDEDREVRGSSDPGVWTMMRDYAGIIALGGVKELKSVADEHDQKIDRLSRDLVAANKRISVLENGIKR